MLDHVLDVAREHGRARMVASVHTRYDGPADGPGRVDRGQHLRESESITLAERRYVCPGCGSLLAIDIVCTDAEGTSDLVEVTDSCPETV